MDKSVVEGTAIDKVNLALRSSGIVSPKIKEGDTTLSWDGELFIYDSEPFNKKNLLHIIPVQVKGRKVVNYRNNIQIEVADLINYKKKHCVIFFLVQFVNEVPKIYYNALQLYDLEKHIKKAGKREKISLPFEVFPEKGNKIKTLILNFVKNAKKQAQLIPGVLSLDELQKRVERPTLTFDINLIANFNEEDLYNSIKTQKPYFYYKDEKGVEFAVDKFDNIQCLQVGSHYSAAICVDNVKFYNGYNIINDEKGTKFQIGRYVSLFCKNYKLTLKYVYAGTIEDRLQTLQFVLAIHDGKTLFFGEEKIPIEKIKLKAKDYNKVKTLVGFYKDVKTLFSKLGIIKELNLDRISQEELNNLYDFCQSELYHKEVSLQGGESGKGILRLDDINIYCLCVKGEKGNRVYSIFNDDSVYYQIDIEDEKLLVSPYLMLALENNAFDKIDNINYSKIVDSIKRYGINDKTETIHINLLLKMLLHYDKTKEKRILDACIMLSNILYEKTCSETNFINLCQSVKRKESLSQENIDNLITIKEKSEKLDIKLASCILLEARIEAKKYFSTMSLEEQEDFRKYPIINLCDELKDM